MTKEIHEKYAYSILRILLNGFPEMNGAEEPDYLSDKAGLEITRALLPSDGEYTAFLEQFMNSPYSLIPKKRLTSLGFYTEPLYNQEMNCFVQRSGNGISLYYVKMLETSDMVLAMAVGRVTDNAELLTVIKKAVSVKLKKLNSNYTLKETNDLALITEKTADYITLKEDIINSKINIIRKAIWDLYIDTKEYEYHFNSIFILFWDVLICKFRKNSMPIPIERHAVPL